MDEKILTRLGAAVRARREKLGISQIELARTASYAANNLSRFESGQQRPSDDVLERIAQALDTSIASLYIAADSLSEGNVTLGPDLTEQVPLLGYTSAGAFKHVRELEPHEVDEWYPTIKHLHGQGFALRIKGDSMTAPYGRSYPDGCIGIFNAGNRNPENGDLVLAKIAGSDEITFKKYVCDAGECWLAPLNPNYPTIHKAFKVLAVFEHAILF